MIALRHPVRVVGGKTSHVKAFEAIAIGQPPRCHAGTLQWLLQKELIKRLPDRMVGRDRFGPMFVPQYEVSLPAHHAWCTWASEWSQRKGATDV